MTAAGAKADPRGDVGARGTGERESAVNMVRHVAIEVRRNKFERSRRGGFFDETVEPTETELDDARAAIEALREPTAEMIDAGRDVGPDAPYGAAETAQRFRTMMDKALSEQ